MSKRLYTTALSFIVSFTFLLHSHAYCDDSHFETSTTYYTKEQILSHISYYSNAFSKVSLDASGSDMSSISQDAVIDKQNDLWAEYFTLDEDNITSELRCNYFGSALFLANKIGRWDFVKDIESRLTDSSINNDVRYDIDADLLAKISMLYRSSVFHASRITLEKAGMDPALINANLRGAQYKYWSQQLVNTDESLRINRFIATTYSHDYYAVYTAKNLVMKDLNILLIKTYGDIEGKYTCEDRNKLKNDPEILELRNEIIRFGFEFLAEPHDYFFSVDRYEGGRFISAAESLRGFNANTILGYRRNAVENILAEFKDTPFMEKYPRLMCLKEYCQDDPQSLELIDKDLELMLLDEYGKFRNIDWYAFDYPFRRSKNDTSKDGEIGVTLGPIMSWKEYQPKVAAQDAAFIEKFEKRTSPNMTKEEAENRKEAIRLFRKSMEPYNRGSKPTIETQTTETTGAAQPSSHNQISWILLALTNLVWLTAVLALRRRNRAA